MRCRCCTAHRGFNVQAADLQLVFDISDAQHALRDRVLRAHRPGPRVLDLVDEDRVGQAQFVELPQHRLGQNRTLGSRIDHNEREVGGSQRGQAATIDRS